MSLKPHGVYLFIELTMKALCHLHVINIAPLSLTGWIKNLNGLHMALRPLFPNPWSRDFVSGDIGQLNSNNMLDNYNPLTHSHRTRFNEKHVT